MVITKLWSSSHKLLMTSLCILNSNVCIGSRGVVSHNKLLERQCRHVMQMHACMYALQSLVELSQVAISNVFLKRRHKYSSVMHF